MLGLHLRGVLGGGLLLCEPLGLPLSQGGSALLILNARRILLRC